MKFNLFHNHGESLFTLLFFMITLLFFGIVYDGHLHFSEQLQLFLFSSDHLTGWLRIPGGLAGYVGEFLTQFYYWSFTGALVLSLLLLLMQQLSRRILFRIKQAPHLYPLSFIPAILYWMMICDEFYLVSGLVGTIGALWFADIYTGMHNRNRRMLAGILGVPAAYYFFGGAYMMLVLMILLFELLRPGRDAEGKSASNLPVGTSAFRFMYIPAMFLWAFVLPIVVKQFLIQENFVHLLISPSYYNLYTTNLVFPLPPALMLEFLSIPLLMVLMYLLPAKQARSRIRALIPALVVAVMAFLGIRAGYDPYSEVTMKYDYFARNEKWEDIVQLAEKKPPLNDMSLSMLNLALAETGQLADRMFHYRQHDANSLVVPYNADFGYPVFGSEVFYHLGLINASQQFAFESLSSTPGNKLNVRAIKRLAETNLINGQYEVAHKYITLLKKTLFYRKWAVQTEDLLYHEERINNHPVYGAKREIFFEEDFFMHVGLMEDVLKGILRAHPQNRMAFEYLMAWCLVNKDLDAFIENLELLRAQQYAELPKSYQEAVYFIESLNIMEDPMTLMQYRVSDQVMDRLESYATVYTQAPNPQETLRNLFRDTYWYFYHYL